jgi:hypothetical protein
MTKNRDFKRIIRARLRKTGESYTTARARLLDKRPEAGATTPAEPDYATLAGISDEAVKASTGCTWKRWVGALDYAGADAMSHREIARYVHETWDIPGWWAQTVTVGYERIKGLRAIGQRRDGTYEVSKSRTLEVPVDRLYEAFADPGLRRRWLPATELTVRRQSPAKSMRITCEDGTPLDVYFSAKGETRSQVTLQHRKLASSRTADDLKAFWSRRLEALGDLLGSAQPS